MKVLNLKGNKEEVEEGRKGRKESIGLFLLVVSRFLSLLKVILLFHSFIGAANDFYDLIHTEKNKNAFTKWKTKGNSDLGGCTTFTIDNSCV